MYVVLHLQMRGGRVFVPSENSALLSCFSPSQNLPIGSSTNTHDLLALGAYLKASRLFGG